MGIAKPARKIVRGGKERAIKHRRPGGIQRIAVHRVDLCKIRLMVHPVYAGRQHPTCHKKGKQAACDVRPHPKHGGGPTGTVDGGRVLLHHGEGTS